MVEPSLTLRDFFHGLHNGGTGPTGPFDSAHNDNSFETCCVLAPHDLFAISWILCLVDGSESH